MNELQIKDLFNPGLFWDIKNLYPAEHSSFLISRVLEEGDANDIRVLFSIFSENQIEQTVQTSRRISDRTRIFWHAFFDQPGACL